MDLVLLIELVGAFFFVTFAFRLSRIIEKVALKMLQQNSDFKYLEIHVELVRGLIRVIVKKQ